VNPLLLFRAALARVSATLMRVSGRHVGCQALTPRHIRNDWHAHPDVGRDGGYTDALVAGTPDAPIGRTTLVITR
jgi:hypothetical protein